MRRTFLVLVVLTFGMGAAFAQSGTPATGSTTEGSSTSGTSADQPPKPKKKKGREWGRFSSQRVGSSQSQPPPPKVGISPRLE
jgi:hypothetical protein